MEMFTATILQATAMKTVKGFDQLHFYVKTEDNKVLEVYEGIAAVEIKSGANKGASWQVVRLAELGIALDNLAEVKGREAICAYQTRMTAKDADGKREVICNEDGEPIIDLVVKAML